MTKSFTPEQEKVLQGWTTHYPYPMMGLLMAMRQVQEWHSCVTTADEEFLAALFKTTVTHVHGVVTFYPSFTTEPAGRRRVCLCRGLSCRLKGSSEMARYLSERLGAPDGGVSGDGSVGFETVECLGACDCGPALSVDDELVGPATKESVDHLASELGKA
ncbi:MAG: NAD(P)H-dependent oxidoreductase subunit E [Elusimicrobia bacterium]|nr:NAD(P)H-dependent oxidoreductase subunit E [Elusimicrobiota bacterium]